jgi:hypothetical protein
MQPRELHYLVDGVKQSKELLKGKAAAAVQGATEGAVLYKVPADKKECGYGR